MWKGGSSSLRSDESSLLRDLGTTSNGLSSQVARERLVAEGKNIVRPRREWSWAQVALHQLASPIAILLILAAFLSATVGDESDGLVILGILLMSGFLGAWQERRAHIAIQDLLDRLDVKVEVMRDDTVSEISMSNIVRGDEVLLKAGSKIPGDCRLLDSKDLFVDEAVLTGESFPAEKREVWGSSDAELADRGAWVFFGSYVVSGSARAVVVRTAPNSVFGELAKRLAQAPPQTEFESGIQQFGYMLLEVALVLSVLVFGASMSLGRAPLDSLLFTLALTVGMTPQLLPAIVTVTMSQAARRMAKSDAIVRRMNSIADIGGMSVLCIDKTGTLTEGEVAWTESLGADGEPSSEVELLAYLNAKHETGFDSILDRAIRARSVPGSERFVKRDEVPYDFHRRRLSVLLENDDGMLMITKGAVREVLDACSEVMQRDGSARVINDVRPAIECLFHRLSAEGLRCLAVATKRLPEASALNLSSECEMMFRGLLAFSDPVKSGVVPVLREIERCGVTCKLITGDNRFVAAHVVTQLGVMKPSSILTGEDVSKMSRRTLMRNAAAVDVFAEIDPVQKERIIQALRAAGFAVGYLGDGINDAAALHAADVGISVDSAVDITKEAADIVLLRKDLGALLDAIKQGREAFANTLKYVFITASANFGNMFSMAGASLLTHFLPFLPKQILLLNVLSDLPAMAIAGDRVDAEMTARPLRWNAHRVAQFMVAFGLISSFFDYLTFGALLYLDVTPEVFRSAWFMESLLSEILILLVIRTRRSLLRSQVGRPLLIASVAVGAGVLVLPYTALAPALGFEAVDSMILLVLAAILAAYVAVCEGAKRLWTVSTP